MQRRVAHPRREKRVAGLQNAGALGWKLTEEEIAKLDEASDKILQ